MERTIQDVARAAGTTSRALRHYGAVGLLHPSRTDAGGRRFYDDAGLVRLQRILLLRALGLGLPDIRRVLDEETDDETALTAHLGWLREERTRLDRRIAAVESTIERRRGGEDMDTERMFDGFDHAQFRDEVVDRWGEDAWAAGDSAWKAMTDADKRALQQAHAALAADWADAAERGADPEGEEAQALATRHVAWLSGAPGVPRDDRGRLDPEYVRGLGEMYVDDERHSRQYGGVRGAELVRDALAAHVE